MSNRGRAEVLPGTTDNNRKARFYALTPAGTTQLAASWSHPAGESIEKREWDRRVAIMQAMLGEPG